MSEKSSSLSWVWLIHSSTPMSSWWRLFTLLPDLPKIYYLLNDKQVFVKSFVAECVTPYSYNFFTQPLLPNLLPQRKTQLRVTMSCRTKDLNQTVHVFSLNVCSVVISCFLWFISQAEMAQSPELSPTNGTSPSIYSTVGPHTGPNKSAETREKCPESLYSSVDKPSKVWKEICECWSVMLFVMMKV